MTFRRENMTYLTNMYTEDLEDAILLIRSLSTENVVFNMTAIPKKTLYGDMEYRIQVNRESYEKYLNRRKKW